MRQCQQLYARGNVLLRKFHMCAMDVKVKLFNTYCSPMYTAQLWWNCHELSGEIIRTKKEKKKR